MTKFYEYEKCSTCRKVKAELLKKGEKLEIIPIVENPPSLAELRKMLKHLQDQGQDFRRLFNTSGALYREMKISDQLKAGLTEEEALKLMSKNGKLIKRPFVLRETSGWVGSAPISKR